MSYNSNNWKVFVLLLKEIAEQKGISQNQIAEKTGLLQSNISRMFALRYCPTLDTFLKVSQAIEVNFFFHDKSDKTELNLAFEKAMQELGRRNNPLKHN